MPTTTAMLSGYKVFQNLRGSWAFIRVIENTLIPALSGTVSGTANFTPVTGEEFLLRYRETGEFIAANGTKTNVSREYFYAWQDSKIHVFFSEQGIKAGLFHVIDHRCNGDHLCIKDMYVAKYEFPSSNEFKITYQVNGPEKNYTTMTTFNKLTI